MISLRLGESALSAVLSFHLLDFGILLKDSTKNRGRSLLIFVYSTFSLFTQESKWVLGVNAAMD